MHEPHNSATLENEIQYLLAVSSLTLLFPANALLLRGSRPDPFGASAFGVGRRGGIGISASSFTLPHAPPLLLRQQIPMP